MTAELIVKWLREVWDTRPGALLKKRGMLVTDVLKGHLAQKAKRGMLVIDVLKGHLAQKDKRLITEYSL